MKGDNRAAAFLAQRAREIDAQLGATLPRVAQGNDPEAVHDMRVALRRLCTLLRLARPLFGRFHADTVRRALSAVQRASSPLRDEEALAETLRGLEVDDLGLERWCTRRQARARALQSDLNEHLLTGELRRARKMLHALLTLPVKPSRDLPAAKLARRVVVRARKKVASLHKAPPEDVAAMHELRIAAKKLRYAAEILRDVLPDELASLARPAATLQRRLGDIHDADVALAAITRARGLPASTRERVLERLRALRASHANRYLEEMGLDTAAQEQGRSRGRA